MPKGHAFSWIGVLGCLRGLPECPEYGGAGKVGKVQPPAVLVSVFGALYVPAGIDGKHRQLLPLTRFLESFLEYVHSFRYRALRPTFTGPVFLRGSSGALG